MTKLYYTILKDVIAPVIHMHIQPSSPGMQLC